MVKQIGKPGIFRSNSKDRKDSENETPTTNLKLNLGRFLTQQPRVDTEAEENVQRQSKVTVERETTPVREVQTARDYFQDSSLIMDGSATLKESELRANMQGLKLTDAAANVLQTYTSRNRSSPPGKKVAEESTVQPMSLHTATFEEDKFQAPSDFALGENVSESSNGEPQHPEYDMFLEEQVDQLHR